jgi:hypothetical protein
MLNRSHLEILGFTYLAGRPLGLNEIGRRSLENYFCMVKAASAAVDPKFIRRF